MIPAAYSIPILVLFSFPRPLALRPGFFISIMTITLTPDEILVCQQIGGLRAITARAQRVVDTKVTTDAGLDIDQLGFIGEYAFCKAFNICPDFGMVARSGSYDCLLERDGQSYRVDVKTTKVKTGRLLATRKVNPDVDLYVLAIVDGLNVHFPGFALKNDLIKEENLKDLTGRGIKGYALEQSALRRWRSDQDLQVA